MAIIHIHLAITVLQIKESVHSKPEASILC
uniref:Uncharacterized protein n=1 Tax=Arundo donax TaxID=35708 RepID=A0A0A8Y3V7_ARUDO